MSIRAKFTVTQITETKFGPGPAYPCHKSVILEPRYDQSIPEDVRFSVSTPSGKMEMRIDNPVALAQFIPGESFYVDFSKVKS